VVEAETPFHRNLLKYDSFVISMCVKGSCEIKTRQGGESVVLKEGFSCLIPASVADYDIVPIDGTVRLLDAYIDNMDRSLWGMASRFLHLSYK
jgi:mannose-6-phosphate isomerase